jgi:hypothetical protein
MSQHYNQPAPATSHAVPGRGVRWLLLGVWALLTLAAAGFVFTLGTNVPYEDEWEFVPALTGHEPALPWLWARHNEHRLPLPRAVYLGLFRLTHDFRSGMFLQVAMLSALSLGLMRLAARLRGRPHWADAFFPLALLQTGHWENFLVGYQLRFALFAVLVTGLGVVVLRTTPQTAFRSGVIAGVLLSLLALCGGFGLAVALPVAVWLLYLAVVAGRTGPRWRAAVLVALALLPAVSLADSRPASAARAIGTGVVVTGQTLAVAPGVGLAGVWPWVAAGVIAVVGVTLAAVERDVKSPEKRPAAAGVGAVLLGIVLLALAVGFGWAGMGDETGLRSRYALLVWPLLGVAYLFWAGRGGWGGKWVPILLCAAVAAAFPTGTVGGLVGGSRVWERAAAIEADARAGLPAEVVAARHLGDTPHEGRAVRAIPMLRAAGVGAFAGR